MTTAPTTEDAVPDSSNTNPYSADDVHERGPINVGVESSQLGRGDHSITKSLMFNIVIPLALLAAGGATIAMLGKVEPKQRPAADMTRQGQMRALPAVSVERIESLESTGAQLQLRVDGTVVPFREVRIASEVAGQIVFKAPECEAGTYVRKDQVLMRIDPTDYELEVERLTRLQEQEYQTLRELDQEELNAKRQMELADQDMKLQERELARRKSLPSGFASQAEIDQANRAVLTAQQGKLGFENQLDLIKKRRVRLEASERLAATQLKGAEVNLQRAEIKAPIDGVIVSEDAELNTFVARGNTIVTMEDTQKVEVATSLRMDQLHWVLDQKRSSASTDATRGYDLPETPAVIEYEVSGRSGVVYRWNGRLMSYNGIGVDRQTRTVPVRVLVDDPQHYRDENGELRKTAGATALVRGMFVRVKLLIQPQTPLVVIPARAIKPGNRVWQFQPDESVLNLAAATPSPTPPSTPATSPEEPSLATPDAFDASDWVAGKVVVRDGIVPVDSLELNDPSAAPLKEFESPNQDSARRWVCEVRDGSLQANSLVVVSPLGNVDSDFVPARADVNHASAAAVASDSPASDATVADATVSKTPVSKASVESQP